MCSYAKKSFMADFGSTQSRDWIPFDVKELKTALGRFRSENWRGPRHRPIVLVSAAGFDAADPCWNMHAGSALSLKTNQWESFMRRMGRA